MSNLRPLGPQTMLARLEEFRGKTSQPTGGPAFQIPMSTQAESSSPASGLYGSITPEGTTNEPWSPFGPGTSVQSTMTPEMLRPMIEKAAQDNGLDASLLDALVQTESNYDPGAVSSKRAIGLTQLMPDTAKSLGVTDPYDPAQNLNGGAKYLAQMINRFKGDMTKAVAAYNAGPGTVDRFGGVPPYKETQNYVQKVMGLYRAKKGV